jgi:AcrR family transcriptional regulator
LARIKGSDGRKTADKILTESLPLITRLGYSAVSMRMIAEAVGVNVGALYNHYSNKQQILVALLVRHMDGLLEAWAQVDISDSDPAEQLDKFVRFHIQYNLARPDEVFISYMELRSLEDVGFKQVEKLRSQYEDILRNILFEGQDSNLFRVEDSHVAAMSIFGALTGVNTWYRSGGRLSKSKIEDYYAAMALRSVGCLTKEYSHV